MSKWIGTGMYRMTMYVHMYIYTYICACSITVCMYVCSTLVHAVRNTHHLCHSTAIQLRRFLRSATHIIGYVANSLCTLTEVMHGLAIFT